MTVIWKGPGSKKSKNSIEWDVPNEMPNIFVRNQTKTPANFDLEPPFCGMETLKNLDFHFS